MTKTNVPTLTAIRQRHETRDANKRDALRDRGTLLGYVDTLADVLRRVPLESQRAELQLDIQEALDLAPCPRVAPEGEAT